MVFRRRLLVLATLINSWLSVSEGREKVCEIHTHGVFIDNKHEPPPMQNITSWEYCCTECHSGGKGHPNQGKCDNACFNTLTNECWLREFSGGFVVPSAGMICGPHLLPPAPAPDVPMGVCAVTRAKGAAITGPCPPDEYLAALKGAGAGSYNLTLPAGGYPALGDINVQAPQAALIRADPVDASPAAVAAHFSVEGRLELQRLRIEGQEAGVASLRGADGSAYMRLDRCELVGNAATSGGAIVVYNGELQVHKSLFDGNQGTDPDCEQAISLVPFSASTIVSRLLPYPVRMTPTR